MSDKKRLSKNIVSFGVVQIANYVFPLISIPIVSRIIGAEKFGLINYYASIVTYFTLIIGYGFDLTAIRKVAAYPESKQLRTQVFNEVFSSQLFLFILCSTIFLVLINTVTTFQQERQLLYYSYIICISTLFTQNWLFQAMQDLSKVAVLNMAAKILYTIMIILFIKKRTDYLLQPLFLNTTQIFISIASFIWSIKKYNIQFKPIGLQKILKILWDEKAFFFSVCVLVFYSNANILLLGIYNSKLEVGYFSASQKIISIILSIIIVPFSQAFYPFIGKMIHINKDAAVEQIKKIIPIVFYITLLGGCLLLAVAPYIVKSLYGKDFLPSIPIVRILAFIPMIIAFESIVGTQLMLNLKMDKYYLRIISTSVTISLLFILFFNKKLGTMCAPLSWILYESSNAFLMVLSIKNVKKINIINPKYFTFSVIAKFKKNGFK